MSRKKFTPGKFVLIPLQDSTFAYGRLLQEPAVSFYDFRTEKPNLKLDEIASNKILFNVSVHKSMFKRWEIIGEMPLEEQLLQPIVRFHQEHGDFQKCKIWDYDGNEREASPEECEGLERSAVWDPEAVEDRLLDTFLGRPNRFVEQLRVRYSDPQR